MTVGLYCIYDYDLENYGSDIGNIPEEAFEILKVFDLAKLSDFHDFMEHMEKHYTRNEAEEVFSDLFKWEYHYDYTNGFKYVATH